MPKKRLLVIPARGGSKRIPRKNLYKVDGKFVLQRTLETAIKSGLFSKIVISSDDDEILSISTALGLEKEDRRPDYIADDEATVTDVLKYEVNRQSSAGVFFNEIWQLSVFSFLLSAEDLKDISGVASSLPEKSLLIGALEFPVPINWALNMQSDGILQPYSVDSLSLPSQSFKKLYYDSGCFAVFPAKVFENPNFKVSDLVMYGYKLPRHKAIDVDEQQDLDTLEYIFLGKQKKEDSNI